MSEPSQTAELSSRLTDATGAVWLTREGKARILRLIDVVPAAEYQSGRAFLTLETQDRPAYRLDDRWAAQPGSSTLRSGFVIPGGSVGVWAPAATDRYTMTITWGVA
ncbi:MAG: hypothetical protein Q4G40_09950 [Brachybacterium sp.]|nr:hypothetical protein [Brachybacterium sp.]